VLLSKPINNPLSLEARSSL